MNLRSDLPFWLLRNGLSNVFPSLEADQRCDALIVGGGITGALLAHEFAARGIDTILVDRRHAAFGSTSASTGLLQYEIDTPLDRLKKKRGERDAERAYWLGVEAIHYLARAAGRDEKSAQRSAGFSMRTSLMLARNQGDYAPLRREFDARRKARLAVRWLETADLKRAYGIQRPGAILSRAAAEVDPYRLTQKLLADAVDKGVRVLDRTELVSYSHEGRGVVAATAKKRRIRAKAIFFATGYEVKDILPKRIVDIDSTYALVTEPLTDLSWWKQRTLIWESGEAYLYARTTDDNRVLIGGADDKEPDAERRDARIPNKSLLLLRQFRRLFPKAPPVESAFEWAGAFGHTKDGLAYIGPHQSFPRGYFALGFGGNGITFSAMACRILGDLFEGKRNPDAAIFAFDR